MSETTQENTDPNIKEISVFREHTTDIDDAEKLIKGKEVSDAASRVNALKAEIAAYTSERNPEIKKLTEEMFAALRVIELGKQTLQVACTKRMDYNTNMIQYIFKGNVIEECAMTADDLQEALPIKMPEVRTPELTEEEEIRQTIQEETNKKTKRASTDGAA